MDEFVQEVTRLDNFVRLSYTRRMKHLTATMEYLREMRKKARPRVWQGDIAHAAGVTNKQVWRWERGENKLSAAGLAAYMKLLNLKWSDIADFLNTKGGPAEDGRLLAERVLSSLEPEERAALEAGIDRRPTDERLRIAAELRQLAADIELGHSG